MTREELGELTFEVPAELRGRFVEVAYALSAGRLVRHVTDFTTGRPPEPVYEELVLSEGREWSPDWLEDAPAVSGEWRPVLER